MQTRQENTTAKTFRWNPTVQSYVLWQAQAAQKAGTRTGVRRFQERPINNASAVGWEVRITATDAGHAWVAQKVAEVLSAEALPTAAPWDPRSAA